MVLGATLEHASGDYAVVLVMRAGGERVGLVNVTEEHVLHGAAHTCLNFFC